MNYKKLNTWLKFDEGGKVFTKNMDGYTIYLGNYPYFILNISCFSIPLEGKVSKAQVEQITEASLKNECFVTSFDGKNDILCLSLPAGRVNQKFAESSLVILKKAIEKMKELGLTAARHCVHCGEEAGYLEISKHYLPLHEKCKEELKNNLMQTYDAEKKNRKKMAFGILFPFLFGLIGLLPMLLILYFLQEIYSPLFLFVPIGVFLGYRLSKQSQKKWMKIYCLVMEAIFILGTLCGAFFFLANGKGMQIGAFIQGDWWYFIRKILFSILFILGGYRFGVLYFLRKTKNYEKILKDF